MKLFLKRLVQLIGGLVLVLVLALAALHWYQPKVPITVFPAPKPISGAAVYYNQAFAVMPELVDEEKKLLGTPLDKALDIAKVANLFKKYEPSLKLLEQGAKKNECEWGLDFSRGCSMPVPHLGKSVQLAKVLALRARLHLEAGETSAATADLLLGFKFARQLGTPPLLICNLVEISVDSMLIRIVTRYLPSFDGATLQKMADAIVALPAPHSTAEALMLESRLLPYSMSEWLEEMKANAARAPWHERLKYWLLSWSPEAGFLMLPRASSQKMADWIQATQDQCGELARLMKLPYAEGRSKMAVFHEKIKKGGMLNPIAALMLPPFDGVREKESQCKTGWTIFQTALAAQLRDPASVRGELAKLRDPYDDSPMEWRDVPGGVEVKLKGPPDKKPLTLMVGLSGK